MRPISGEVPTRIALVDTAGRARSAQVMAPASATESDGWSARGGPGGPRVIGLKQSNGHLVPTGHIPPSKVKEIVNTRDTFATPAHPHFSLAIARCESSSIP